MLRLLLILTLVSKFDALSSGEENEKVKVIIIGAGVSGFAAAARLLEKGIKDILILEGSNRIGGRIHTVMFGGKPIDKGAEFIDGIKDNAVYDMLGPEGKDIFLESYLPYVLPDKVTFADIRGKVFNSTQVFELLGMARDIFKEDDLKNETGSMADYFEPRFESMLALMNLNPDLEQGVKYLATLRESTMRAVDSLDQLGSKGTWVYEQTDKSDMLKWATGGYKTIFDYISKKFPNPQDELPVIGKTLFNKLVIRIHRRESDVVLKCADGSTYIADHVIVTVSLGVLKRFAAAMFHPPLPTRMTQVIKSMGFGCMNKFFLLFDHKWWPNEANSIIPLFSKEDLEYFRDNSVHGHWTSYLAGFFPVMNYNRMLCTWFSGNLCELVENLSDEQIVYGIVELLDHLFCDQETRAKRDCKIEVRRPEQILRTTWNTNKYSRGAFSYRSVESDRLEYENKDLAIPILSDSGKPLIMFAGEATHNKYSASVHGALATGRREADNLLKYFESLQ